MIAETNIDIPLILTALTPVMLAVLAFIAERDARQAEARANAREAKSDANSVKSDVKLDEIHTLVNDNLTKAKSRELIALQAWAMSMEGNPERDDKALGELKDRIVALTLEIEERDRVASGIPSPTEQRDE